jgi:4-hydroxy-3-polyprenylbenzoate decarboxylase
MSRPRGGPPDPPRGAASKRGASGAPSPRAGQTSRREAPAGRGTLLVGISGASGAVYGVRLVECVVRAGRRVHLIITAAGRTVLADELGMRHSAAGPDLARLWPPDILTAVTYTPAEDLSAPPASGSFGADAMAIVPCSMNTVAALAHGLAGNLLQRAAYAALKEGRPLVVVPREMPLVQVDFENMARLAAAGAVVMPAMPGFYHHPRRVADLVDFVVAKVLDRLGIAHSLDVRWPGCEAR